MGDKENDRENEGTERIVIDGDKDATDKVTKTMTRSKRVTTRYVPLSQYCARSHHTVVFKCKSLNQCLISETNFLKTLTKLC